MTMRMMGRVRLNLNVGCLATARDPATLRAAAAELLATAVFVLAAEGATLSFALGSTTPPYPYQQHDNRGGLVAVALAHALALAAAVACTLDISGGHVNPAVTLGALLGGRICLVRSLVYWAAQLLGAVAGALVLRIATGGVRLPEYALAGGINGLHAVVLEAAMAFGLVYAYYATAMEQRAGAVAAPLAVGLLAGANVLACGALDGAVMNPARAFGPPIVGSRQWTNHWVYWVGPMVGAGLSGFVYEHLHLVLARTQAQEQTTNRGTTRRA
ncbi:unnamed protein product [Urochloa decumbens]|uniref:Uncharacterized protein n=1 Tax=Urochloa decumbens TaxID=240449 RepID=A0ABC8XKK4_9POAL